jgi:transposase
MRDAVTFNENLFTLRKLEDFILANHPLRSIRKMAIAALAKMDRLFAGINEAEIRGGRPSIPPEKLMRVMLWQVHRSVRSERQLMEQVQYNLMFRWFIRGPTDDATPPIIKTIRKMLRKIPLKCHRSVKSSRVSAACYFAESSILHSDAEISQSSILNRTCR